MQGSGTPGSCSELRCSGHANAHCPTEKEQGSFFLHRMPFRVFVSKVAENRQGKVSLDYMVAKMQPAARRRCASGGDKFRQQIFTEMRTSLTLAALAVIGRDLQCLSQFHRAVP